MNVVTNVMDFKRVHVVHYWIRIVMFAFSVVFVAMWFIGTDATADVDIFDISSGTADLAYGQGDDPQIGICPSNRWYFPFINSDGDFNVSWSDDNGTTWDNVTVQSAAWKGETLMVIQGGIQTWVNNTTVVMLRAEGADRAHDLYLFWLWGENDPSDSASWNYTQITSSGSTIARHSSMIFNRTGMLYLIWNQNSAIRSRTWDVSTGTFDTADALWLSSNEFPMIQCDYNNVVWVSYQNSPSWQIITDWAKGVSMQVTTSNSRIEYSNFHIASDNVKVLTGHYQYLTTHQFAVAYESAVNTTLTANLFQSDTDDWATDYWSTGNIVGTTVSITQLRQESGSDEYVRYRAAYDAVDATWEGSETVLWTVPTSTDDARYHATGPNSIWPKIGNVSVCMATGGTMYYWHFKDELGATDDYYDIIYYDAPTFPYWDWPAPAGPDPDPDGGSEDPTYGFDVCNSSLLMASVIFLLFFVMIGVFLRNAL